MKKILLALLVLIAALNARSQNPVKEDYKAIKTVLRTFMKCLTHKDSLTFYNLFHTDPVVWVGVTQSKTFAEEIKRDSTAENTFKANYKAFYRFFHDKPIEEKFYNIQINTDGYIASVTFDYSFWQDGKKINWGKESWAMIKTKNQWKITSVVFSSEEEAIRAEPKNKKRKNQIPGS